MATAKSPGRGRLPALDNLINKTPDQLIKTLDRFGLAPDMADMNRRADRAFDRLLSVMQEGGTPDDATWEAIDNQIEKEMGGWLRQQVKSAINGYKMNKHGASQKLIWIAVGDSGTCVSCEGRHGKIKTKRQWEAIGLPGSSSLVCRKECRCGLHAVDA